MTREEHLLVILAEECNELAKESAKALRFGLNNGEPGKNITNRERITIEFNDLFSVVKMCVDEGILNLDIIDIEQIDDKRIKVEKYLEYSKNIGKLI